MSGNNLKENLVENIRNNVVDELAITYGGPPIDFAEVLKAMEDNHSVTKIWIFSHKLSLKEIQLLCAVIVKKDIRRFELNGSSLGNDGVMAVADFIRDNNTVTILDLKMNQCQDEGARALAAALKVNKKVTDLDISFNDIGQGGALALVDLLKTNQHIAKLTMGYNNLEAKARKGIVETLTSNVTLTHVSMNGTNLSGQDLGAEVLKLIQVNATITYLSFADCGLGPNDVKGIAEAVKANRVLKNLSLYANEFGTEGCKAFGELFAVNNVLKEIDISDCKIDSEGIQLICEGLKKNSVINTLFLDRNPCFEEPEAISTFAEYLKTNRSLTHVFLADTMMDLDGLHVLCQSLKYNCTVAVLGLNVDDIGSESAVEMADLIKCNFTLGQLDLAGDIFDEEGKRLIEDALKTNGSLLDFPNVSDAVDALFERNISMHLKVGDVVATMLAVRRFKSSWLNDAPKEIVAIIAKDLLKTKIDVEVWSRTLTTSKDGEC